MSDPPSTTELTARSTHFATAILSLTLLGACSEDVQPVQSGPIGAGGMTTSGAATTSSGAVTTGGGVTSATTTASTSAGAGGATTSTGATSTGSAAGGTGTTVMPNLMGDAASTEGCERAPSIIETTCSLAGCHLDMREPNFVGDFITELRTAGTRSGLCQRAEEVDGQMVNEFRLFIDPNNPADSYIIEKINPLPCDISDPTEQFITGFQMPLAPGTTNMTVQMSAEDIQCLTDWIIAVAPP